MQNNTLPFADHKHLDTVHQAASFILEAGFDLPVAHLTTYMQAQVMTLVEGRAIDARTLNGQTFVRMSELVHFTSGDWPPEQDRE